MPPHKPHTPTLPHGTPFEQLETVLRSLLTEHERLLALSPEQQRAVAQADARALSDCMSRQHQIVQRIASFERQRQGILADIVRQSGLKPAPKGAPAPAFSTIASSAPEPVRTRLSALTTALREVLNRLHREHLAIRAATETLAAHMEGLLRQACQRLSHSGTYARGGRIGSAAQVVSSMDLRS